MNQNGLKKIDLAPTALGGLAYAWSDKGLHRVAFVGQSPIQEVQTHLKLPPQPLILQGDPAIREAIKSYFMGNHNSLNDIPLVLEGSEFQLQVWNFARSIAYGQTVSYGSIASALNRFNGARAVGLALSKNPIPLFVPCHRVLAKSGSLTGYVGGLDRKRALIIHESTPASATQTGLPWM